MKENQYVHVIKSKIINRKRLEIVTWKSANLKAPSKNRGETRYLLIYRVISTERYDLENQMSVLNSENQSVIP